MKVFVFVEESVSDGCDSSLNVTVYETIDQARQALLDSMKDAKIDFMSIDSEQHKYHKNDMCWSIWEKYAWSQNHTTLMILERDVQPIN